MDIYIYICIYNIYIFFLFGGLLYIYIYLGDYYIWIYYICRFPKIGVPPNHPVVSIP